MEINIKNDLPKLLQRLTDDLTSLINHEVESIATDTVKALNSVSPTRTGKYKTGWKIKKGKNGVVIYNKDKYQLTHLLEHGHAKRGGGRVSPIVHIAPIEEEAIRIIEDKIDDFLGGL